MSGPDQGDEDKGFLARWSQRKQGAKQPDAPVADADLPAKPVAESEEGPEFDLSSLPKLEEMTASTDISAFLRKGVPEHLRNAALRKSWALDPAIRNYVNPALEYAYDWNTPGGVPGSGEIGAGMDVARMVSQIMGGGEAAADPATPAPAPSNATGSGPAPSSGHVETQQPEPDLPTHTLRLGDEAASVTEVASKAENVGLEPGPAQDSGPGESAAPQHQVRRHGTAKPIV